MIISTGMNSLESVSKTVAVVNKHKIPHVLLHCVNLYPVNYKLIRLNRIKTFQKKFSKSIIGMNHFIGQLFLLLLGAGARVVEKHFVISKKDKD